MEIAGIVAKRDRRVFGDVLLCVFGVHSDVKLDAECLQGYPNDVRCSPDFPGVRIGFVYADAKFRSHLGRAYQPGGLHSDACDV